MALTMKHSIYRSSWESKCKVILLALLILVTGASATSGGGAAANTTITSSEATNNNSNYSVTYDRRSLIVNGHRKLLISASIHYPRSVPAVSATTNS